MITEWQAKCRLLQRTAAVAVFLNVHVQGAKSLVLPRETFLNCDLLSWGFWCPQMVQAWRQRKMRSATWGAWGEGGGSWTGSLWKCLIISKNKNAFSYSLERSKSCASEEGQGTLQSWQFSGVEQCENTISILTQQTPKPHDCIQEQKRCLHSCYLLACSEGHWRRQKVFSLLQQQAAHLLSCPGTVPGKSFTN